MRNRLALTFSLAIGAVALAASPAAGATATLSAPDSAEVGDTVTATVTLSEVMILARWTLDWGDGDSAINFDEEGTHYPTHVYDEPGTYDISVTVDEVTTTVSISIGTFEGTFADDDNSPFVADIEWLATTGITRGCNPPANTLFCPTQVVTRGQMAAFLSRALEFPTATAAGFVDTAGHTFEADIDKLAEQGVTLGCNPPDNDHFCPNDPVTRGQMAAFLVRAFEYTDSGSASFTDISGNTFEASILKLATAGVTRGCNPPANDRFCPTDRVTRGQMAAFLHRAMGD